MPLGEEDTGSVVDTMADGVTSVGILLLGSADIVVVVVVVGLLLMGIGVGYLVGWFVITQSLQ